MNPVEIIAGDGPLVLAMPHAGLFIPDETRGDLNDAGQALADTDWNVDRLYAGLLPGATLIKANFHRYVIDANRPPDGASLYPGQNTTELCPTTDFDGRPIYHDGRVPDAGEIERRRLTFHAPYHAAIEAALERTRARYGIAILYDAHSIRSEIPYLFDGRLPDFNIGTNDGAACAPRFAAIVENICRAAEGFTTVMNGRFKGGWTTRRYGRPEAGIHAIQMELAQATYMDEAPPWTYREDRVARLRPHLQALLSTLSDAALSASATTIEATR